VTENDSFQIFNPAGFKLPVEETTFEKLKAEIEKKENITFQMLELVYVDEDEIIRINKQYLNNDYITDIITFRYDERSDNREIEGTLFCCAARIEEQSKEFHVTPNQEFCRVFIHGLLHLACYQDQTKTEKKKMTALENYYLSTLKDH
jgi:probable rRNA maturation factor